MPPRISRSIVEPRSVILKKVSTSTHGGRRAGAHTPRGRENSHDGYIGPMPEEQQPVVHEIGNRTYIVADVEPLDVDGVRTLAVGTAMWAVAFVLLVPFSGRLRDDGHLWWMWTCVAGFGLGLLGWDYCRRRRNARQAAAAPDSH